MNPLPSRRWFHGGLLSPRRTLLLSSLALALYLLAGPAPELLVYDRSAIAGGEWWRLFTAHLVHSDAGHALWNIAAFALLGALFEARLGGRVVPGLLLGALAIDAWLWWAEPELLLYCGLSGVINALMAASLWRLWQQSRDSLLVWIGIGAIAKIALETAAGGALFTQTLWGSVPQAHAVGFAAGLLSNLICRSEARYGASCDRTRIPTQDGHEAGRCL